MVDEKMREMLEKGDFLEQGKEIIRRLSRLPLAQKRCSGKGDEPA